MTFLPAAWALMFPKLQLRRTIFMTMAGASHERRVQSECRENQDQGKAFPLRDLFARWPATPGEATDEPPFVRDGGSRTRACLAHSKRHRSTCRCSLLRADDVFVLRGVDLRARRIVS